MFTGIITKKVKVLGTADKLGVKRVLVENDFVKQLLPGQSISINGVCSTVTEVADGSFTVEYMQETLSKTTMQNIVSPDFVNIEFSLKVGDPIDGHFVYGHIDCLGFINRVRQEGDSKVFSISIPKDFHKYIAYKGSITVDGVSLTISAVSKVSFEVSLIPYTLEHTTLGEKKAGNMVNIETDIISRYLERLSTKS